MGLEQIGAPCFHTAADEHGLTLRCILPATMKHKVVAGTDKRNGKRNVRYFFYCDAHSLLHVNDPHMVSAAPIPSYDPDWPDPEDPLGGYPGLDGWAGSTDDPGSRPV